MTAWVDRRIGGLIPLVRLEREAHAFDGTTYKIDVTWARRAFGISYHTPRASRGAK